MRTSRPDPWLLLSFIALSIAVSLPLWGVTYLPFLDIPQHLMTIQVMHSAGDPDALLGAWYTVDTSSTQYLLYYLSVDVLAHLTGIETANKLFIAIYLIGLPWSLWYLLRAFGRIEAVALLGFPLAFNKFLFMGFINYVFALPLFLLGLGLARRALDSETTCRKREAGLLLVSLLIFYSHLQIFLLYVGALGLFGLLHWRSVRGFVVRNLHLIPALLLFGFWLFGTQGLAGGDAWESAVSERYASLDDEVVWDALESTLRDAPDRLLNVYHDDADDRLNVLVGLSILLLLLLRRVGLSAPVGWRAWGRELAPEFLTLFVILFYLALPTSYQWIWPVNWRFLPVAVLLLLTWGRAQLPVWGSRGLIVCMTAIAAWSIAVHERQFDAFDAEAAEFTSALEAMEPGSRVMQLTFASGSKVLKGPVYLHFGQYHTIRQQGLALYSFAEAPQSPVRFRPRSEGGPPPTPLRSEWKPHEFTWGTDARYYDYFLVRGDRPGWFRRQRFPKGEVRKVHQSGPWAVYHYDRNG
ncbi:MAG: hypothetical protein ACI9WU_002055 [Myxococcota bacterium]